MSLQFLTVPKTNALNHLKLRIFKRPIKTILSSKFSPIVSGNYIKIFIDIKITSGY